jgi:hypothetical protein
MVVVRLDRGMIIGSISGLAIFIVIILIIFLSPSDFDEDLVSSVNSGTPADKLIPQIEKEHDIECSNVKNNLNSRMMGMKEWGNGDLGSDSYYDFYTKKYEEEIHYYNELEALRIQFAQRQISKDEFLSKIENKNF